MSLITNYNNSQITSFILSGLNEPMNLRVALFSVTLLCYCFIVMVNVTVIVVIILDKNMHEPMYILLCTLCMNGLYGTTSFYPKFLWDLLSAVHVISYSGCLVQALVMYSFVCSDLSILAVMSYDRYVAICRPLVYHSVMSKKRLLMFVSFSWFTPFCLSAVTMILTSRLMLCSRYVARLYCVNLVIVKLACSTADTVVNNTVANLTVTFFLFHGIFIVLSYVYVIRTCVNSLESRAKFMQTCVPHLTSLLFFVVTMLLDVFNLRFDSNLSPTIQNVIAIELLIVPPIMNPLVYGFKLTKIRIRILSVITCQIK
ncbi:olfactory receptor 1D2-like [Pungitius pungitius]|uniref:olfactory receptor 1D2-like n=1 Tax=Pungitius pungitius TaxID=134920 RepID=UPI002E167014